MWSNFGPNDNAETEIPGGYIKKKDDRGRNQRGLLTGQEFRVRYEEPKETELTEAQKQWMAKYRDDFEKALMGPNFRDRVSLVPLLRKRGLQLIEGQASNFTLPDFPGLIVKDS